VKRAARVALAEDLLRRRQAAEQASLRRRLASWHVERVTFASAILDRDPDKLINEYIRDGGHIPGYSTWPPRLRDEAIPQLREDKRFRPRADRGQARTGSRG
jgi:hypothetical protein